MSDANGLIFGGRLGKDPVDLSPEKNGTFVAFTIAQNNEKDQPKEKTIWLDGTISGSRAVIFLKWAKKGSSMIFNGKIKMGRPSKCGKYPAKLEINASDWDFGFSSKKEVDESGETGEMREAMKEVIAGETKVESNSNYTADDIPF